MSFPDVPDALTGFAMGFNFEGQILAKPYTNDSLWTLLSQDRMFLSLVYSIILDIFFLLSMFIVNYCIFNKTNVNRGQGSNSFQAEELNSVRSSNADAELDVLRSVSLSLRKKNSIVKDEMLKTEKE